MKRFCQFLFAVAALASCQATQAQYLPYDLIYDPGTGSLTIDTKGGVMGGYVLEFNNGTNVFNGPFQPTDPPANLVNMPVNLNQIPIYAPGIANRIGFSWYLSEVPLPGVLVPGVSGVFDIGPVVTPGLTEQQYVDTFSNTTSQWQYVGGLGSGISNRFNLVYVPEPTSLALLGFGGLVFARRRRA
jgi:hypothetical protein